MILITSKKGMNRSVEQVIDWIEHFEGNFIRLNGEDLINDGVSLSLVERHTLLEDSLRKVNVLWFRGLLHHRNYLKPVNENLKSTNDNLNELYFRLRMELFRFTSVYFEQLENVYQIPKFRSLRINKYLVLQKANNLGLEVPASLITNSKRELLQFIDVYSKVITKPLYETLYFDLDKKVVLFKYELVDSNKLKAYSERFFISFFQEYINKEIEIRTFFLNEDFYSMAIFSQLDQKTKVDFRNYNNSKPNRTVPYNLPKEIIDKLKALMSILELNTGSIDLIKAKDGKYYFLEVNPTGQFGMTSFPCNFYLEKKIAKFLIHKDEKK